MMISENDVYSSDFKLFGSEKYMTYVETRMEYHEVRPLSDFQGSTNAYVSIFILLDNQRSETIRQVSTFLMAI